MALDESKIPETTPEEKRTVGRFGEPTTINQETFEIVGRNTGTVFGQGADIGEALALQTAGASGSSPTVAGRPDLLATEQRPGVAVESFVDEETGQTINPSVATPEQLAQKSAGTLESFDSVRGLTPETPELPPATPGDTTLPDVPTIPTDFATAAKETLAAGVESEKQKLLGAPESFDNQLMRQKAAIQAKLLGQDLTPDELKWLTPSQSKAVLTDGPDGERLMRAELAGMASLQLDRKEQRKEEEERATKQFDLFLESGTPLDQLPQDFLNRIDDAAGVPRGLHESIYRSQTAASEAEAEAAELESMKSLVGLLNDIPLGQPITIGGVTYTGLDTSNLTTIEETDANGNVTVVSWDPVSNQIIGQRNLGNIGTGADWERKTSTTGVQYLENEKTGERRVSYNGGSAGGGMPTGGLMDIPNDSFGDECGVFVRKKSGMRIVDPNAAANGINPNSFQSKMNVMDSSITAETVQVGDVFVQSAGVWTGHTGFITGVHEIDGEIFFDVKESNWGKNQKVGERSNIPASKFSGFARPGLLPEYQFGTDTGGIDLDSLIEAEEGAAAAPGGIIFASRADVPQGINGFVNDILRGATTLANVPTDLKEQVAAALDLPEVREEANTPVLRDLNNKVDALESLTSMKGFNNAVGTSDLQRMNVFGLGKTNRNEFIGIVSKLTDEGAIQALQDAKAKGATFGALSDSELNLLKQSASTINGWAVREDNDPAGKIIGYAIGEDAFEREVQRMIDATRATIGDIENTFSTQFTGTGNTANDDYINSLNLN